MLVFLQRCLTLHNEPTYRLVDHVLLDLTIRSGTEQQSLQRQSCSGTACITGCAGLTDSWWLRLQLAIMAVNEIANLAARYITAVATCMLSINGVTSPPG